MGRIIKRDYIRGHIPAALIFISVVALDQITKILMKSYIQQGNSVHLIKNFLKLTYVTNTGSAFGMLRGMNPALILISAIIAAILLHYLIKTENKTERALLSLILGGTVGNLIDRIAYGSMVDFIEVPRWPVFNIADSAISIGVILLIAVYFRQKKSASL